MFLRKCAALVAASLLSTPSMAQDSFPVVDWGPMMQTEAMNSAMDYAARQGSGTQSAKPQARSRANASSEKAHANCARARQWAADGIRDPKLPRLLSLCGQAGY